MSNAVPWWANSLLSTLLALIVAGIAVSFDRRKTINQELIKKRIQVYEWVAPHLNDLYFFFFSAGERTELTPPDMIERKNHLDRLIELYGPLFSESVSQCYGRLIDAMFETALKGWNEPPKLKASLTIHKMGRANWQAEWDDLFVTDGQADYGEFLRRYNMLMDQFAVEIGARHWRAHWLMRWKRRRRGL